MPPMPPESQPDSDAHAWVIKLLETLAERTDASEWISQFRSVLGTVVQVDRISVDVHVRALVPSHDEAGQTPSVTQHITDDSERFATIVLERGLTAQQHIRHLLSDMKQGGFNFGVYRRPHIETYELSDGTYLGAIVLWQLRTSAAIPKDTIDRLRSYTAIITTLLIDCAARHMCQTPVSGAFYLALERMRSDGTLTPSEHKVITLRLLGQSYKSIAAELDVTIDTVSKHVAAVHRKTGTHGLPELVARYFSPLLRPPTGPSLHTE